jgi:hypothetical protein
MEQSSSCKANTSSASQEIPLILWNVNVDFRDYKIPQFVPIFSQMIPFNTSNIFRDDPF